MDLNAINEFWHRRAAATDKSIRWTDHQMLSCDLDLVRRVLSPRSALLDLGCGTGDLFLPFLDDLAHVTAVDMVPDFLTRIPDDPRIERVVADLSVYQPSRTYDLGLLFGVVTHLASDAEAAVYDALRTAVPAGIVLVKNQCGREKELFVDNWSDSLGSHYVGRYPTAKQQATLLGRFFNDVEILPYPETLNRWKDSHHIAYICR
jgi:SAM-dependent methyltransferase